MKAQAQQVRGDRPKRSKNPSPDMHVGAPFMQPIQKAYRPRVGAYIAHDKVLEIIAAETERDPIYGLAVETVYTLGLRVSELVGDKTPGHEKPGIRFIDIDSISATEIGLDCNHTIRIWRKRGKFEVLPLPDDLFQKLLKRVQDITGMRQWGEQRLFPMDRTTFYQHLKKYGRTIDGRFKIGCHVLRRSAGVHWRAEGLPMEAIQKIYSHETLAQTFQYIGLDKREAFNAFARWSKK